MRTGTEQIAELSVSRQNRYTNLILAALKERKCVRIFGTGLTATFTVKQDQEITSLAMIPQDGNCATNTGTE